MVTTVWASSLLNIFWKLVIISYVLPLIVNICGPFRWNSASFGNDALCHKAYASGNKKFLQDQHSTAMLVPVLGFELYTAIAVLVILCVFACTPRSDM